MTEEPVRFVSHFEIQPVPFALVECLECSEMVTYGPPMDFNEIEQAMTEFQEEHKCS